MYTDASSSMHQSVSNANVECLIDRRIGVEYYFAQPPCRKEVPAFWQGSDTACTKERGLHHSPAKEMLSFSLSCLASMLVARQKLRYYVALYRHTESSATQIAFHSASSPQYGRSKVKTSGVCSGHFSAMSLISSW